MQDSKSLHSALPELTRSLFEDFTLTFPHLSRVFALDQKKFEKRLKSEGLTYVTKLLPSLSKSLLRGLETGTFLLPLGFKRIKESRLPMFLHGLFSLVFQDDGSLRSEPDENAIFFILQFCNLIYKLDLPHSKTVEEKFIEDFKRVDQELASYDFWSYDPILEEANRIMIDILKGFDPMDITPKHGPGSVATGERYEKKWNFKRKYRTLHKVYPYYEYFVPSRSTLLDSLTWYRSLEELDNGCAKVHLVPKDSRGPRIISMEPLEYQFIQQGLSKALVGFLETRSPAKGFVNFTDQKINGQLALANSITQSYATLDMKEASDRVSLGLVKRLFCGTGILKHLLSTRTSETKLPSGEVIRLNKFAPMGSALCFPVEALCFYSLAKAVQKMWKIRGDVFVYGDDIIVPKRLVPYLFDLFPNYGLKFNEDKCFFRGKFRESCGVEAYNGVNVTPWKIRHLWPRTTRDAFGIASVVALINQFYTGGLWRTARFLERKFVEDYKLSLPVTPVSRSFSGLSWKSFQNEYKGSSRWNRFLQHYEYKTYQLRQKSVKSKYSYFGRLFANLVGQVATSVPVPQAGSLKLRWCA